AGDPVVLHDQFADRWIVTQFTAAGPTYFNCVAISTTSDPTGSYYRYAISTGTNFPDYPKYGVWSDAYYISTREFAGSAFAGVGAYALNRTQMIAGNPSPQVISFLVAPGSTTYNIGDGLLPADLDGNTLPPNGSPEYFVGSMDNGGPYGAPQDALTLWKFTVNWTTPASSSFVLANTIPVAAFDSIYPCTPAGSRFCIPQPGTTNKIDILSYRQRPTWRLAYRNFGTHESLVTNQSVEAVTNRAGVRWWEIRDPNGTPVIFQEGTYAPDATHRWMGSIAMDKDGNMGLAYSASSSTVFPSLWYTGRLAGDPLGTMPQGEASIHNGTGSQTSGQRWGDYTSLNVDPSDDCTFWYVNEYLPTNGSNWRLRIGAFKFPSCTSGPTPTPGPTNTPTLTPTPTNTPDPGSTQMHVSDIAMSVGTTGSNRNFGQAVVTIVDPNNVPVSGATVFGTFSGDSSGAVSGVTNANGQVTLTSPVKKNGVNWTFCVTNVTKSGWTYNAGANVETCDSTGGSPTATPTPTMTPTPPPGNTMHIGDLDGSSAPSGSRWTATVVITVHDSAHNPIAGVTVSGAWSNGASGSSSCVTDSNGQCTVTKTNLRTTTNSVTFTVTNATHGSYTYQSSANHDPDGDSNGTTIVVNKP
ncbi:MAG: Ig-like domain-containing protein, partial [Anaerolineales bacterium]|nr:Ig-like domain-containing protein [Anaerolineales bacterium]